MAIAPREALIIDAVRTPRGKGRKASADRPGGALADTHPQALLATCLRALEARNPIAASDVDDVVAGCVNQAGDQGACIARMAVLAAGWPDSVPGVSLNRFCGSGLQGVNFAAMGIASGQQDLVVGGGVESMSRQSLGSEGAGLDGNNAALRALYPLVPQGIGADLIATLEGFDRDSVDAFAAASQRKAAEAIADGRFARGIVPVHDADGETVLDRDELPRPEATIESLATLAPAFVALGAHAPEGDETYDEMALRVYPQVHRIEHVHHAGNSSGIVDGAGAVLLASGELAASRGLAPRARILATATAGTEPVIMLTAPGPARASAPSPAPGCASTTSICGRSTRLSPACP